MTPLDAWRDPDTDVLVAIDRWLVQEPIRNQFIARPRSPEMAWNYLRRIGPAAVWRKVRSRLDEERRNRKVAGIGTGWVLEAPSASGLAAGQHVVFFAPNHSANWPRLSIDRRLVKPSSGGDASTRPVVALSPALLTYVGWSRYAGIPLDERVVGRELEAISVPRRDAGPTDAGHSRNRHGMGVAAPDGRPRAVLFGLGNYAKTQIVPHVRRHLHLSAIHEIDPDQIASAEGLGAILDTSPRPSPDESYAAWFIAGFHHTHAALAVRALADGAYAVVEKPLATTREQLRLVEGALHEAPGKLFTCFHRRYSAFNERARLDLETGPDDPVDMHCLVYEVPLPALHWYNWPSSGSRLLSNGCHWLDYFLYMNGFHAVKDMGVRRMRGQDILGWVSLVNGAQMVMSLTDTGSQRLGVRDLIELRAHDVTVRIADACYYEAEPSRRILCRRHETPMDAYRHMYDAICHRIAAGQSSDSLESLRSTRLTLDPEEELSRTRPLS